MSFLKSFWDHPYTFWVLLSLPALPTVGALASGMPRAVHIMVHPTGEFAARFLIIAMMITPLAMLLKGWRGPRWKTLQRFTYGAAVLTLVHWAAVHNWSGVAPALVHFGPLIALEIYRVWSNLSRARARAVA